MQIWKYSGGVFVPYESLTEALGLDLLRKDVISAVGAGGKTTILERLAAELSGNGRKVLTTTTTHLALPEEGVFFSDQPEEIIEVLGMRTVVIAGHRFGLDKIEGLPVDVYTDLCEAADTVLVEADGSRGLPLKTPAAHEPCIPPNTTRLLILAGLDSIGHEIDEVCHRPDEVRRILKTFGDHRILPSDIALLLREGYIEPYAGTCAATVILNKADRENRREAAAEIAEMLAPVPVLMIGRSHI